MISVAIPVYNGLKFVENAVESITKQEYKIDQIIIVDDKSTDEIGSKINELKKKYLSFDIRFFANETNVGYQANWNNCFDYCKTKYLVILHQDDMLIENSIKTQIDFLKENSEVALVGGKEDYIDELGRLFKKHNRGKTKIFNKGQIFEFISQNGTYIPCSSVMFDMDKIRQVGYFDTDVLATDELYWPKVLTMYPVAILGQSVIYRRNHPGQAEWSDFYKKRNEVFNTFKRFNILVDYETRDEKKKEIAIILKKKFCNGLVGIAGTVIRYYHSTQLAFWYLSRIFLIDPFYPFQNSKFWKVVLIGIVNAIGLINFSKKIKHFFTRKILYKVSEP